MWTWRCVDKMEIVLCWVLLFLYIVGSSIPCSFQSCLSYESCHQLFTRSSCSQTLLYADKLCTVLNTSESQSQHILLQKSQSFNRTRFSAIQKFHQCIKGATLKPKTIYLHHLPLLGIVISVTQKWADSHRSAIASIVSNFNCYAAAQNYSFVSYYIYPSSLSCLILLFSISTSCQIFPPRSSFIIVIAIYFITSFQCTNMSFI